MPDSIAKRLELAFRRGLIAAANRLARRTPRTGALELAEDPRILLLRHDRFGDAIVSTAIMKLLRDRYPSARIDVLLGRRNRAIAPLLPAIDETLVLDSGLGEFRRIGPMLKERRYDVVVNLLAKDSSSGAILSILSGARYRVGFEGSLADIYDFAIPGASRPMHIVPLTARLLAPFGIPEVGDEPVQEAEMLELRHRSPTRAPIEGRSVRIVFSISARDDDHMWPDAHVVELLGRMREDGHDTSVAGTPEHRDRVEAIAAGSGADALVPSSTYQEFVDRLAAFDLLVTPQTSTVHVGSALRIPTVLLNTDSESDRQWTPWGIPSRTLERGPRLSLIPVDDVADAVRSLIEELRRGGPA